MTVTFEQLKIKIQEWLGVNEETDDERLPNSVCGDLINICSREYLRRRESRLGETTTPIGVSALTSAYAYPQAFSKPRKLWYVNTDSAVKVVARLDKDIFDVTYPYSSLLSLPGAASLALEGGGELELEGGGVLLLESEIAGLVAKEIGEPVNYTIWAGKIVLAPCPGRALIAFFDHYSVLADLANGASTNENRFTKEAWEYLLFAALVKASEFGIEDERAPLWMAEMRGQEIALDLEDSRQHTTGRRSQSTEPG